MLGGSFRLARRRCSVDFRYVCHANLGIRCQERPRPIAELFEIGLLAVRRAGIRRAGRYDVKGMAIIVSRGTGTWGPRMRLWHPGEIVVVKLRARGAGSLDGT